MQAYTCFFSPYTGDVDQFVVIEARDDARARRLADDHLNAHPSYRSVEIFEGERRLGKFQRAAAERERLS